MVKLTPELINQSMQFINPCRERELDLRGYKIPQIENLGATLDQFDTIDLSDNDLRKLDGLPFLPRLKCLLLNNNRILRIGEDLQEMVPNLNSVILSGNNLQEFGDLDPLSQLPNLETLCLLMNPVSTKTNYREYMAWKFPQLRLLDFRKIKQKDRKVAQEFFRSKQGKDMLKEIAKKSKLSAIAVTNEAGSKTVTGGTRVANADDLLRIREAIKRASSLQEVERLSQILQSGRFPDNFSFNSTQNGTSGRNEIAMDIH
ncbi:probable U2 small nuclear ribonucleoprotein A' [Glossina fuscipes]|uniref:Probable U2 small nuclear ribonucleoprotein A' n=2 Tax=Nemorhina TaxID=44051 RepID=A0A9C5YTW3_9MUSC|nr:probable U2 small nuclear ribonucleoprotein A' [Glossina fuscipes]KAI9583697.1 hypothetical protein GQX74_005445 [Glossina fuscipes]